jgi:NTP pyrophosphatase (non-canonical NTP hydrolase)
MVHTVKLAGDCSFRGDRPMGNHVDVVPETIPYPICFTHRFSRDINTLPQLLLTLSEGLSPSLFVSPSPRGINPSKIQVHESCRLPMRSRKRSNTNVYQFPLPLADPDLQGFHGDRSIVDDPNQTTVAGPILQSHPEVVVSGTFRKDPQGLRGAYQHLEALGFKILSPTSVSVESEAEGFVFMEGESRYSPEDIELRHLNSIQRAVLVWLHAPDGYVGTSGSLEVGFAHAIGVPVYSQSELADPILRSLVTVVPSPESLIEITKRGPVSIPRPPLRAFQEYYKRAAIRRGYAREDAKDTLILMLEEFGELARAIRKRTGLARHGSDTSDEGLELADVFIYVVHMANVLDVDLSRLVQQKELWNLRKFEKSLVK